MIESRAVEGLVPVETTDEGATLESLAHRKLDSFRHEAALSTWLHRLAVNRCLDHVRSRAARQDAVTEPLDAEAPPPARGPVRRATCLRGSPSDERNDGERP